VVSKPAATLDYFLGTAGLLYTTEFAMAHVVVADEHLR
jgi:hypothetical protein